MTGDRLGGIHSLDKPLLYNLAEDVSENTDVADKYPGVVKELLTVAKKARAELGNWNRTGSDFKKLLDYTGEVNRPTRIDRPPKKKMKKPKREK